METVQSNFVIVGANTPDMKVFFNGEEVTGVADLKIDWDIANPVVILTLNEAPLVSEMKANGIQVRRTA